MQASWRDDPKSACPGICTRMQGCRIDDNALIDFPMADRWVDAYPCFPTHRVHLHRPGYGPSRGGGLRNHWYVRTCSTDRPTNQSINQSIDRSSDRSIWSYRSIHSVKQPTKTHTIDRSRSRSRVLSSHGRRRERLPQRPRWGLECRGDRGHGGGGGQPAQGPGAGGGADDDGLRCVRRVIVVGGGTGRGC
jgi:hypothetical protein